MAGKAKNAPAAKSTPTPEPQDPNVIETPYNPATDPNKTAQERLDALTEQQNANKDEGTYPL